MPRCGAARRSSRPEPGGRILGGIEVRVDQFDVGVVERSFAEARPSASGRSRPLIVFNSSRGPSPGANARVKASISPADVLASQRAEEVEHEQEREAIVPGDWRARLRKGREPTPALGLPRPAPARVAPGCRRTNVEDAQISSRNRNAGSQLGRKDVGLPSPLPDRRTAHEQLAPGRPREPH